MNRDQTAKAAEEWIRAHERGAELGAVYNPLRYELAQLLPDCAALASIPVDDKPAIAGVEGAGLYLVTVAMEESAGSHLLRIGCRRYSLSPEHATTGLQETISPAGERKRHWTFRIAGIDQPVQIDTREHQGSPLADGVPPSEQLAREIASVLGWQVPGVNQSVDDV